MHNIANTKTIHYELDTIEEQLIKYDVWLWVSYMRLKLIASKIIHLYILFIEISDFYKLANCHEKIRKL